MEPKKETHIMYGFITSLIMAIIGLALYLAGVAFKPGMQYLPFIPFIAGIVLNAHAYSKANEGLITFGNAFSSGFKASMIIAIVMTAWIVISIYIFPDMKTQMLEEARHQMALKKDLTDDQIDKGMALYIRSFNTILIAGTILKTLFFGVLFALIAAATVKRMPATPLANKF